MEVCELIFHGNIRDIGSRLFVQRLHVLWTIENRKQTLHSMTDGLETVKCFTLQNLLCPSKPGKNPSLLISFYCILGTPLDGTKGASLAIHTLTKHLQLAPLTGIPASLRRRTSLRLIRSVNHVIKHLPDHRRLHHSPTSAPETVPIGARTSTR